MALNIDIAAGAGSTIAAGSMAGAGGLAIGEAANLADGPVNAAGKTLGGIPNSTSGNASFRSRWQSALATASAGKTVPHAIGTGEDTQEDPAAQLAATAPTDATALMRATAAAAHALNRSAAQNAAAAQSSEEVSSDARTAAAGRSGKQAAGSSADHIKKAASEHDRRKAAAGPDASAAVAPAASATMAQSQMPAAAAFTASAASALLDFLTQTAAASGQPAPAAATETASADFQSGLALGHRSPAGFAADERPFSDNFEAGAASTASAEKPQPQSEDSAEATRFAAGAAQPSVTGNLSAQSGSQGLAKSSAEGMAAASDARKFAAQPESIGTGLTADGKAPAAAASAPLAQADRGPAGSSRIAAPATAVPAKAETAQPSGSAARSVRQTPSSGVAAADSSTGNRADAVSTIHAVHGSSGSQAIQPEARVSAAQPEGSAAAVFAAPVGPMAAHAAQHMAQADSSAAAASARETFTALDAAPASTGPGWVHAGARQAEAGFNDPSLGWVGVRADLRADGVHAAIVPGSADAAETLGGHIAGLSAHLAQQHIPVETLGMASTTSRDGDASAMQGGAGQGHTAGQNNSSGSGTGQETHTQSSPRESGWAAARLSETAESPLAMVAAGTHISVMA